MKPLSPKTLEKKYALLGLPADKLSMLHAYFRCFANLYGLISLRDAWSVFRYYEGVAVHKKDFAAFSGIVRREAGLPYSVYELRELYRDEESDDPMDRMIVNNDLVQPGYYRFSYVYVTDEKQENKPYYLPDKQRFLSFTEDRFYLSAEGKAMAAFIKGLRTGGVMRNYEGSPTGALLDIRGEPASGKKLSDFVFCTQNEQFDIEYHKSERKKQALREEYAVAAADKLLDRIRMYIMTGGLLENSSAAKEIDILIDELRTMYDVQLTEKQFYRFCELFAALNNRSNLWLNCGWAPNELFNRDHDGAIAAAGLGGTQHSFKN